MGSGESRPGSHGDGRPALGHNDRLGVGFQDFGYQSCSIAW